MEAFPRRNLPAFNFINQQNIGLFFPGQNDRFGFTKVKFFQ